MALVVGTNSYISVADATTYFEGSIDHDLWDAATNDTRERALISATRMMDRQDWLGSKYSSSQDLEWPRSGLTDKNGDSLDETTVPQQVLDATCELASALIDNPYLQDDTDSGSNIKKLKAGSAEIEFIRALSGTRFPTIINELVGLWLSNSGSYTGPLFGGLDNESSFSANFDLTRGL